MKKCSKCGEVKEKGEFHKATSKKDGLCSQCKLCRRHYLEINEDRIKERRKRYQDKNRDKRIAYMRQRYTEKGDELRAKAKERYRQQDPSMRLRHKEKSKQYTIKVKDKIKEYKKYHYEQNKIKIKEEGKSYRTKNRSRIKKYMYEYTKNRRKNDSLFLLRARLSGLIYHSLKAKNYKKNTKTAKLLGADLPTVQQHLIDSAIRNYGKYFPKRKYHIDHIIPCASAKTEEELIALQHYTNLQYLYPKDNLEKSDKLDWDIKQRA